MRIDAGHRPRSPFFRTARADHPPHVIRLRGPWRWEIRSKAGENAACGGPEHTPKSRSQTFTAPDGLAHALTGQVARSVRLSRRFHCPTGLQADAAVELVIARIVATGQIRLNGVRLGPLSSELTRYRITEHLQPTNELQLDLTLGPEFDQVPDHLRVDVRLEIVANAGPSTTQ